jgi:hypothetical protein
MEWKADKDGNFDLETWWTKYREQLPDKKYAAGKKYIRTIEQMWPIRSRQVAAVILATADYIAEQT